MAEGFANCYGSDVLIAESRGLAPVPHVPRNMIVAMHEKNIDTSGHVSRRYDTLEAGAKDIVVNMSGYPLPGPPPRRVLEWTIVDPYGKPIAEYKKTRDAIENEVMRLILAVRRGVE
jgi:protein-tyrosine-phosphatase